MREPSLEDDVPSIGKILEECTARLQARGEAFKRVLDKLRIEPDFLQQNSPDFISMREKLNVEPGLLIVNHPTNLDLLILFQMFSRSDVLLMAQPARKEFLESFFGNGLIIPAPVSSEDEKRCVDVIVEHISRGGLFLLSPVGGQVLKDGSVSFKNGLSSLVGEINDKSMIYSTYINSEDGKRINSEVIGPPKEGEDNVELVAPGLHVRPAIEPIEIRINEAYSQAIEWKKVDQLQHFINEVGRRRTHHFPNEEEFTQDPKYMLTENTHWNPNENI